MKKPDNIQNQFSANLVRLRNYKGITQTTFAIEMNKIFDLKLHKQTIFDWECGRIEPPAWIINYVAMFYETSLDAIYNKKFIL